MSNIQKYNRIFQGVLGIKTEESLVSLELKKTKAWDSVSHLSLVTAMEEEFDVMLDAEEILDFDSYEKGIAILDKYGIHFEQR